MSDLVEHLRGLVNPRYVAELVSSELIIEAADRIASLETQYLAAMEENKALRKALEPFAREAENWNSIFGDNFIPNLTPSVPEPGDRELAAFTVGDLRRARLASEKRGVEE